MDQLHNFLFFYFWVIFFVFFYKQKTLQSLHTVIFLPRFLSRSRICIKKAAGSGSALRKAAGSRTAINNCGSAALLLPATIHMCEFAQLALLPYFTFVPWATLLAMSDGAKRNAIVQLWVLCFNTDKYSDCAECVHDCHEDDPSWPHRLPCSRLLCQDSRWVSHP